MHRRAILILAAIGLLAACASTHAHPAATTSPSVPASSPVPPSPASASTPGGPASAPAKPATLTGNLLAVGGPAGASPRPLPGSVTIAGPVTQHVTVGPDGTYTATVPPGTYTVTGTSPQYNDGAATCHTDGNTVIVAAGQSVAADVLCQEK